MRCMLFGRVWDYLLTTENTENTEDVIVQPPAAMRYMASNYPDQSPIYSHNIVARPPEAEQ